MALKQIPAVRENEFNYTTTQQKDNNLSIIKFLIKKAEACNFKIIFTSTASYKYIGKKKLITKKIYPFNLYSQSKINCEKLLENSYRKKKTNVTILRIFNVYGNNQSKGWLIPDLIYKFTSSSNKKVNLINYLNTRDFIHVEDACRAIIKSIDLSGFNILNIGSSIDTKIITVAKIISKELKSKKTIILSHPLSKKNYQRLTVKPGLWLAFQGLEDTNMLLNLANIEHDPSESVSIALEELNYEW